jgi:hypothetical protein
MIIFTQHTKHSLQGNDENVIFSSLFKNKFSSADYGGSRAAVFAYFSIHS